MNFLVGKSLILLFSFLIIHTTAFISREFLNDLKDSIHLNFKNRSPQRLSNLFYALKTFQITNQQFNETISNNSICRFLNNMPFHEVEIENLVFEYFYLRENLQCYGLDLSQDIDNFMIKVRTETHLNDLRAAIYFSSIQKQQKQANSKFLCQKLADELIEFNENTFNDPKTKGASFFTAELIFESFSNCQKINTVTSRLEHQLEKFSLIVLNNLTPLRKNWRLAAKNDFFTNANLFYWILNLQPSIIPNNYRVYYAQLIHSDKVYPVNAKQIFDLFRLSKELINVPIFSLVSETIDENYGLIIQVSNIFREPRIEPSTTNVKFSLVNEKQQIVPKLKSQIVSNNIKLSFDSKSVSNFGPHQLKIQITLPDSATFDYQIPVIIKEQIHLNYLRVGFSNNSVYPNSHKSEIGYNQRLTKDVNIDQNRFFHIEFRLNQDIKTDLIAVNLARVNNTETFLMKKDHDSGNLWKAVIDFKNRTLHSDSDGTYRLELVISGKYIYPIQWTFAQLHIKSSMSKDQQSPDIQDLFYQQIEPQKSQPSILITGFTNILIITGLGAYFVLLKKTDVTLKDTPKNLVRKLTPILFIILIFSSITICVLFFEKITTFEILFTFLLFVVPIIVIGNMAHGALK